MSTAFTMIVPTPPSLPKSLVVRTVVMREDGRAFSASELEAIAATYPAAEVEDATTNAQEGPRSPAAAKTAKKAPGPAAKPRKAAKRP